MSRIGISTVGLVLSILPDLDSIPLFLNWGNFGSRLHSTPNLNITTFPTLTPLRYGSVILQNVSLLAFVSCFLSRLELVIFFEECYGSTGPTVRPIRGHMMSIWPILLLRLTYRWMEVVFAGFLPVKSLFFFIINKYLGEDN